MQRLFSPWRSQYIESFLEASPKDPSCVLCDAHADPSDEHHLVVLRGLGCYALLNKYPYNSGHLMVVPYRHTADFSSLTGAESGEMMLVLQRLSVGLTEVLHPDGFNIGSNLGRSAGAGIDQHLHFHIVPRWNGDTNFMPVLDDTKVVSEDMTSTWRKLRARFSEK